MKSLYNNRNLVIIIPLVGILIGSVFLMSYGLNGMGSSLQIILHGIIITTGLWLGCLSIVMYLWKKFPWEQRPLIHLILEIVLILGYTLAFSILLYLIERKLGYVHQFENPVLEIFATLLITFFITSIHESIFFYQQWKYNFSKSVRLERDNIEARYEALRAQLNPHFLFNSLNSLATMAENNQPVTGYIQNLSEILRYMLKSNQKELVLLRDEISITNSYLNLQHMRFQGSLEINVAVPESYYHFVVPPLVLQILVENALKHNIVSKEKPLKVEIMAGKESITVSNNLQKKAGAESTGQGLKNIIGRYRFFTSRKVEIEESIDKFKVTLPLLRIEL